MIRRLACLSFLLAVCVAEVGGGVARADGLPVVVVVEAAGTRIDAARIRAGMAVELGVPIISIIEGMHTETLGTLAIAITDRGRKAAISFMPSDGNRYAVMLEVAVTRNADPLGEWLVAPCASAVRTSNERRAAADPPRELLDPWLASRVLPSSGATGPREVIDPWVGTPRRRVRVVVSDFYLGEEIVDPWADAVDDYRDEQAERLTRPAPRRAIPPRANPPRRTPPRTTPPRATP